MKKRMGGEGEGEVVIVIRGGVKKGRKKGVVFIFFFL